MKKWVLCFVTVCILVCCMFTGAALAEDTFEKDGFKCEQMRDGSLKLVSYTGSADVVTIPSSIEGYDITCIGEYAFDGCEANKINIPSTVKVIESFAFSDCKNIQKMTIPNTVIYIDGNPFTGCEKLENISVDPKHPTLQTTSDGVLYSEKTKTILCYPYYNQQSSYRIKDGTLSIGKNAFYGCDLLEQVTIPETVLSIGSGAFYGCKSITKVVLPQALQEVGECAFAGCSSLASVSIPGGITQIKNSTFFGCTSLKTVKFPQNLTEIGKQAFRGCSSLQEITLPMGTKRIGEYAFNGCMGLKDAYLPITIEEIGDAVFDGCSFSLYMHLDEYTFAEIYARIYEVSFDYNNQDAFLQE